MNVALFGASGATGKHVLAALLAEGITVRALCRNGTALDAFVDELTEVEAEVTVVEGELTSKKAVQKTMRGCDAVICLFGPHPPYTDLFCADATALIVESMHSLNISHLLCQTGAMFGDYPDNRSWAMQEMVDSFQHRHPELAEDRSEQERIVKSSGLQWTLIKPPRLTTGAVNEEIQVGDDLPVGVLSSASRATIAHWLVQELHHPVHIGEALFFLD
ncbi:NmrA-like family protein [Mariprofundus micogutta]|uniref:NmrA-like family protein n=1 Tax=Mariprofundus micogutta TaxID=1921010 RepID=A0A1L8CJT4_9PROT|nr:NAD(P)-binding oxidoreductase [Mariprofundus micogutta]GAV19150.1 NmrA-like family protein [Mariprofundus micogutta]